MLRNRCVRCDHVIEAPEEQRGKVVVCPRCEATNVLRGPEDEQLALERERGDFLRRLEGRRAEGARGAEVPAASERVTLAELGHAGDLVLLATRRLQDMGDYLLLFAYGLLALALLGGGALVAWAELPGAWRAIGGGAALFAGALAFVTLKALSDTARAIADLGGLARAIEGRLERVENSLQSAASPRVAEGEPQPVAARLERDAS